MVVALSCSLCFLYAEEQHQYSLVCGDSAILCDWLITTQCAQFKRGEERQKLEYDAAGRVVHFSYSNKRLNSIYRMQREGNTIVISGTVKGKNIQKSVSISSLPWYQSMHDFSLFACDNSQDELYYWVVRPTDLKIVKMKAVKESKGSTEQVQVIKVFPHGLGALFWQAHYTYRKKDGVFLQYRSVNGGPGTPETVITPVQSHKG